MHMNDMLVERIAHAHADVTMPDELDVVFRRGSRIRRARAARRTVPALVAAGIAAALVVALPGGGSGSAVGPVRLVAYAGPEFPITLTTVARGLFAPRYDLDSGFG